MRSLAPRPTRAMGAWATAPPVWGMWGAAGLCLAITSLPTARSSSRSSPSTWNSMSGCGSARGCTSSATAGSGGRRPPRGSPTPARGPSTSASASSTSTSALAWNYYGNWEARAFGYSYNNLNRGTSQVAPERFNDGVGLENRYYLGPAYAALGTQEFDQARANFVSLGYYPTKDMVDGDGVQFKPGPFARAYLTCGLMATRLPVCRRPADRRAVLSAQAPFGGRGGGGAAVRTGAAPGIPARHGGPLRPPESRGGDRPVRRPPLCVLNADAWPVWDLLARTVPAS